MKNEFVVFLFVWLFTVHNAVDSFGQSDSLPQSDTLPQKQIVFQTRPSSWFTLLTRLGLGVEYRRKSDLSISIDLGIGKTWMPRTLSAMEEIDYSLFEIRPEVKIFSKNKTKYWALELFYINYNREKRRDFILMKDGDIGYESALFKKSKTGIHAKIGFKYYDFNIMEYDFFVGGGIVNRVSSFENLTGITYNVETPPEVFDQRENRVFNGLAPHLTIGMKVGFVIKKLEK